MSLKSVLVLGGAGSMGRHTVRALEKLDVADSIIVGGLPSDNAKAFVDSCGPTVSFSSIDILDDTTLTTAMEAADVLINTAGPFYRLGEKVAGAALATGTDYLDICDDPEPTKALLDKHEAAMAAGVTMILGLGLSPGVSNLLAPSAIAALDETEELDTTWDFSACEVVTDGPWSEQPSDRPSAATYHGMHMCSVPATVKQNGTWQDIDPVECIQLWLPSGETFNGWTVAHPESITLPRSYPFLKTSRNFMTGPDKAFAGMRALRDAIRSNETTVEAAAQATAAAGKARPPLTSEQEQDRYLAPREAEAPRVPPLFSAIARGTKDGRNALAATWINRLPAGGMGAGTGIPVAIGAALLAQIKDRAPAGVYAPESAIDAATFFEVFEQFCPDAMNGRPLIETAVSFID